MEGAGATFEVLAVIQHAEEDDLELMSTSIPCPWITGTCDSA